MSHTDCLKSEQTKFRKRDIWYYGIGEGGTSIGTNGINNFALLFYTQVLGLNPALAGLALSISILWDAVSDPVMGYISDNTRSKYGKRHFYMGIGGVLLAASFMSLWMVPDVMTKDSSTLFSYLLVVNLVLRTSLTVFLVPYTALGFEICNGYESRAKLQSVRSFINMCVNFVFGALAWTLFFRDSIDESGIVIDGTKNPENFVTMGITLGLVALTMISLCTYLTKKYASSSEAEQNKVGFKQFVESIKSIICDKMAIKVFGLLFVAQVGVMLTAQLQIFSYIEFMAFTSSEKTFVHGSTMVGFALGALSVSKLVTYFEKKTIIYIAVSISSLGGLLLFSIFAKDILGVINNGYSFVSIPFAFFQAVFWFGAGIIIPLTASMTADVSAVNEYETGKSKNGGYSSMFSFTMKSSGSLALLFTGSILSLAGYIEGAQIQTEEVAQTIASCAFLIGPFFFLLSTLFLSNYAIDRNKIQSISS